MLTIYSGRGRRDCEGLSRRDFIQAGTLGLGGLSLPGLLHVKAQAAAAGADFVRDKAVVMIFLGGGASHIETFNPNMDAPAPYYSVTGEVKTTIPGVTFGGTFPLLARHAKKMAIIRSFRHPVGSHGQAISHVLTGGTDPNGQGKQGFSLGSLYARLRGGNHPETGMPTYCLLMAPHKDGQYRKEFGRVMTGSRAGSLGPTFAPFSPDGGGTAMANMKLNIPPDRLADRRYLLGKLDELKRGIDSRDTTQSPDRFMQQAVDLVTGAASKAFGIDGEDPKLIERYDTSKFMCGHKVFQPSILGRQLLMTRRLIEAGAGFVTVQSAGWDMHADGNNPGVATGMEMLGRPLDKALSAFLEDLEDRRMSDKVLVVLTGDFGRTPKINGRGGRDHWANLCTLALIGGGLKMGQVIGRSARDNSRPATEPISTSHLLATVMHTLLDPGKLRIAQGMPADLIRLVDGQKPIEALF
ncbi:MAG: DUF1501 domain-containing protein [Planctomycetes bacterium]|nr:DUF1501 domain-containing protein [Planctomycetota bacterium]